MNAIQRIKTWPRRLSGHAPGIRISRERTSQDQSVLFNTRFLAEFSQREPDLQRLGVATIIHGSRAWLGSSPEPIHDIDLLHLWIPPKEVLLGWRLRPSNRTIRFDFENWPIDLQPHDLRSFFVQLLRQSPNLLPLLWIDSAQIVQSTAAWEEILRNRRLFLSRDLREHFSGFARHRVAEAERDADPRNIPRVLALVIRILRMGQELLLTGECSYDRRLIDATELQEIRLGKIPIARAKTEIARLLQALDEAATRSDLPRYPNSDATQALLMRLIEESWRETNYSKS